MNTLDQILKEATYLPEDQRLTLVHRILKVGEAHSSQDVEHLWDLEIRDRIALYDCGKSSSRPAGEVFSNLDRLLQS